MSSFSPTRGSFKPLTSQLMRIDVGRKMLHSSANGSSSYPVTASAKNWSHHQRSSRKSTKRVEGNDWTEETETDFPSLISEGYLIKLFTSARSIHVSSLSRTLDWIWFSGDSRVHLSCLWLCCHANSSSQQAIQVHTCTNIHPSHMRTCTLTPPTKHTVQSSRFHI